MEHSLEDQYLIYSYYIPGVVIGRPVSSPLRKLGDIDQSPSFTLFMSESGDRIRFIDFVIGDGDVHTFIMMREGISFPAAKRYALELLTRLKNEEHQPQEPLLTTSESIFPLPFNESAIPTTLVVRPYYHEYERAYWEQRGIYPQQMITENIFGLEELRWSSSPYVSTSTKSNPTFIYLLNKEPLVFKKYSPNIKGKGKWFSHGLSHLVVEDSFLPEPEGDKNKLLIFSSKKDKMVCLNTGLLSNYLATSLIAEGNFSRLISYLTAKENNKYQQTLYLGDLDDNKGDERVKRGIERSKQIEENSKGLIKSLYLPENERLKLLDMNIKDYDDIRVKLGEDKLKQILTQIISTV